MAHRKPTKHTIPCLQPSSCRQGELLQEISHHGYAHYIHAGDRFSQVRTMDESLAGENTANLDANKKQTKVLPGDAIG